MMSPMQPGSVNAFETEPRGAVAIARHYVRDLVYGANDGIITTCAVVAGVAGGSLPPAAVLIVGVANLAADGLSMGVGNYLSIRAHQSARAAENLPIDEPFPVRHGLATFLALDSASSSRSLLTPLARLPQAFWQAPDAGA